MADRSCNASNNIYLCNLDLTHVIVTPQLIPQIFKIYNFKTSPKLYKI